MNKIYIGKRASGKTTLLIKKSAETGANSSNVYKY